MSIQERIEKQTASNLNELQVLVRAGVDIVPFIGAGMSIRFDVPGWKQSIKEAANQFEEKPNRKLKTAGSKAIQFCESDQLEEASEVLCKASKTVFTDALKEQFIKDIDRRRIDNAYRLLVELSGRIAMTTNFDTCADQVFSYLRRSILPITLANKTINVRSMMLPNSVSLIKLHGNIEENENLVFTRTDYDAAYGKLNTKTGHVRLERSRKVPILLQSLALTNVILFVGCSLNADRTLLVLSNLKRTFPNLHLFAIVELPESGTEFENGYVTKMSCLRDAGIMPIWYEHDKHQKIADILQAVNKEKSEAEWGAHTGRPEKVIAGALEEQVKRNGIVRVTCSPIDYPFYAGRFSGLSNIFGILWSMNGSPLDSDRYMQPTDKQTEQDETFSKVDSEKKRRLIIFPNLEEARIYVRTASNQNGDILHQRKYEFLELNKNNMLLFATRHSLAKVLPRRLNSKGLYDFGYVALTDDTDKALIFCSAFCSSDFRQYDDVLREVVSCRANFDGHASSISWSEHVVEAVSAIKKIAALLLNDRATPSLYLGLGIYEEAELIPNV